MDGINASDKAILMLCCARAIKTNEAIIGGLKKMNPHKMEDRVYFSAAVECKIILDLKRKQGAKSNGKYAKREKLLAVHERF